MRSKLAFATLFSSALTAPAAYPCGAPFGNGINVDPSQDIVVVHKNAIETYVFQPRFCGNAREFGLVLPVPAKLTAQPALSKSEVFTRLDAISKPQIQYTTACIDRGWTGGAPGGSKSDAGAGTTVVSSGTVGFMDYAQLDTVSVEALTAWLTANGYPYDDQATATFDYYVKKGWSFLTFKVDQGLDAGAGSCKDLGPIKFSFPSPVPVVPTRMATARAKDTSGALAYATSFKWRIFGITDGGKQIGIANSTVGPNFSGLVADADVASLAGLAVAGDRATKLTITFNYGSTDPDVGLALTAGQDFREVVTQTNYVVCGDGGIDGGIDGRSPDLAPTDAPIDRRPPIEAAIDLALTPDAATTVTKDATVSTPDLTPPNPDAHGAGADLAASTGADGGASNPDLAAPVATTDASSVKRDAPPPTPETPTAKHSSGCSFATASGGERPALVVALVLGLGLALRRTRRRRPGGPCAGPR
jgi:MYXO-CTERM domain-containing protein